VRNLERAGQRFAIGLALVLFAATVLGLLQMFGVL
jgi:hypothetical protein